MRAAAAPEAVRAARRPHPGSYARAYLGERRRWQVSFYARTREEIAQVVVDDRSGRVLETWTGFRVAWPMARGLPGQFGQAANAPWIWIALCALFALPFLRPPWRMLHADLAVLLAFSVSYAFFGAGNVEVSVPTALPPLLWLLGRLLWVAWHRPRAPVRLLLPAGALLWLLAFLVAFRVALNLVNGNVIDVGYAGVVGADRLLDGGAAVGRLPARHPARRHVRPGALPRLRAVRAGVAVDGDAGTTCRPPTARRWPSTSPAWAGCGWRAGGSAARCSGCCSPTCGRPIRSRCVVSNSGSSDALVGAAVLGALLLLGRPAARGAALAVAGLTKFAPLGARAAVRRARPQPTRGAR